MPEKFTKNFAERLNRLTAYPTKEAAEGDIINKGACLIAPGNYHMEALKQADGRLAVHLNQEKPQHGLRPAIDVTMKSLADNFSGPILGIILTGMGKDGTEGMMAIKAKGGRTLVQSPDTAVVDSMPSSVIESGLADEIMPLHDIARRIVELSGG
jgi:two-component system chemotaxis response regulator CheB